LSPHNCSTLWSDVLGKQKQFGFDCVDQWNTKQRNKMEFVRNIKLPHIMSFCLTLQFSDGAACKSFGNFVSRSKGCHPIIVLLYPVTKIPNQPDLMVLSFAPMKIEV
jgi:hypothetical protein